MSKKSDSWKLVYKKFRRPDRNNLVKLKAIIEKAIDTGLDDYSFVLTSHDSLIVLNGERYDDMCDRIVLRQINESIEYEYGPYDEEKKQNNWDEIIEFTDEIDAYNLLSIHIKTWRNK